MVIPQAVAQNFATLLVSRAIAGALGGILQNAVEQFSTDLWATDKERNLPVTLYSYVYVAGVTLGPALGSIVGNLSWRWYANEAPEDQLRQLTSSPGYFTSS